MAAFLALTFFFLVGLPVLIFAGLVLNGFVHAGKWDDDPKNWERAFGQPLPKEVQVIHSTYWRSPHFTLEQDYAFQLHVPPSFATEWAGHYKMRDSGPGDDGRVQGLKRGFPKWFLPKPPSAYHGWLPMGEPYSKFALFVDKETGDLFCTDGQ